MMQIPVAENVIQNLLETNNSKNKNEVEIAQAVVW